MERKEEKVIEERERTDLEKFIGERLEKNKSIFTSEELRIIKSNDSLIKKVYILAMSDSIF